MPVWLGVDVGGPRKGFDVALIDDRSLLELRARQRVDDVVGLARAARPAVVAVDSPRSCAPPGATVRPDERALRRAVCGIRWTPPRERLDGNPYYGWILEGLRLYSALEPVAAQVVECFPTAAWTRWAGARGRRSRAVWSAEALAQRGLARVPPRANQDARDAIAAALTARAVSRGEVERFGEIVVPAPG